MARHASTYRKYRRENWKLHNALEATKLTWEEFNRADKLKFKNKPDILIGNVSSRPNPIAPKPSKDYRGKIGAKDQALKAKATTPALSA